MLAMGSLQETDTNSAGWVLSVVLGLTLLGLIIWWLFRWVSRMEKEALYGEVPAVPQTERRVDDLTRIEGIGPKVASVLQEAGIRNFDALSRAEPGEIQGVLNTAGLQMMRPEGWIDQARLAARDDWDGLEKLQGELKGGRRR